MAYRQYDYHAMMSHSTQLARWLRKHISTEFNFASFVTTFDLLWSTVYRDSNLLNYSRIRDGIAALDEALGELSQNDALSRFVKDIVRGKHNKIIDVRYTLYPSKSFVREMKAANKRFRDAIEGVEASRVQR